MTGEELERAIEFLLKSQARAEARQDRTDQQIAEMGNQLRIYAETQSQFIEVVTQSLKGLATIQARTEQRIAETNAHMAETNARTEQKITEINERSEQRIAETNERFEQLITESRTRAAEIDARLDRQAEIGARTDARLDRLAALVERNITGGNGNLEQ
ncbi:MAG TPA: hypothetical protein VGO96_04740 [Pyrinomonadaceae bacterium]|jgi:uncharacterized protein (DUF885 family)|nr:hypothetical protein [Pyrinomonadaceae bacterium]